MKHRYIFKIVVIMLYNMMKEYKIFIVYTLLILKFKDFFELVEVRKTVKLNYMVILKFLNG